MARPPSSTEKTASEPPKSDTPKPTDVARQGPVEPLPPATPSTSAPTTVVPPNTETTPPPATSPGGTPAKGESEDGPATGGEPMNPLPDFSGARPPSSHPATQNELEAALARVLDIEKRLTTREAELIARERAALGAPSASATDDGAKEMVSILNQRLGPVSFFVSDASGLPVKVELRPGTNFIPVAVREKLGALSAFKAHLEAGKDPDSKQGLRDMGSSRTKDVDDTNAVLMVRNMRSEEALEQALRGESRSHVLAAGQSQKKKLADARRKREGAQE